ncbi:hypothetical protein Q8A67_023271 [Cirrhinus molitorella]|uniref:Secreted protein n=1 Tax=Cirrhinus molitorella TaxID=172907 RepID=A0AA88TKR7_9TELE|nr:hypothetical protein Q8A67_023271 [Cirrhinus molitorella]
MHSRQRGCWVLAAFHSIVLQLCSLRMPPPSSYLTPPPSSPHLLHRFSEKHFLFPSQVVWGSLANSTAALKVLLMLMSGMTHVLREHQQR